MNWILNVRQPLKTKALYLAALLSSTPGVSAALIDRGGGLIYDSYLDVTWLQDANYIQTSGAHPSGEVSWIFASDFANELVYRDEVRNTTWDDWGLPSANILGTDTACRDSPCVETELGHLFLVDDVDLFSNVPLGVTYWTSTRISSSVFVFNRAGGGHFPTSLDPVFAPTAWLLRDGRCHPRTKRFDAPVRRFSTRNVAPTSRQPEPTTMMKTLACTITIASALSVPTAALAGNLHWENVPMEFVEQRIEAITGKEVVIKDKSIEQRLVTIVTPREMSTEELLFFARSILVVEGIRWKEEAMTITLSSFLSDDETKALKKSLGVAEPKVKYDTRLERGRIISPTE